MPVELYFHAPLMEFDSTVTVTCYAIAEHHDIDELIEKLDQTGMSSPVWLKSMKSLKDKVLHHLIEEEKEFFPSSREVSNAVHKNRTCCAISS